MSSTTDLFDPEDPPGTAGWNAAIFRTAFCDGQGPFDRAIARLHLGFSVLVCLPGNCMEAAAEVATRGERKDWTELGQPTEDALSVYEFWQRSTTLYSRISRFWSREEERPRAIFHNLDFLGDGRGGLDSSHEAKTALFYLADCVRTGVVLGLSDRDAGELPITVRRLFADDQVWLDEIPAHRFPYLVPRALGEAIAPSHGVSEGASWLLGSRLRWTDPIRAVKIMDEVASEASSLREALRATTSVTLSADFAMPDELEGPGPGDPLPKGYDSKLVPFIRMALIEPYQKWASFTEGTKEDCERLLRRLPPGLILHGPPGTGKTSVARWIAKSISLPVRQVTAANLRRAEYGLTEQLVKDLFRSARRAAPCVIVLDDADDLLPDRDTIEGAVAGAERGIVNAFLQELEGFDGRLEGVLVILTSNRFGSLDRAVRSKLGLHRHVPYPLDPEQVGDIVDEVARSFGVQHGPIREDLVEGFMGSMTRGAVVPTHPNDRWAATEGLYSPRDIRSAMRLLPAVPDVDHVVQMLAVMREDP